MASPLHCSFRLHFALPLCDAFDICQQSFVGFAIGSISYSYFDFLTRPQPHTYAPRYVCMYVCVLYIFLLFLWQTSHGHFFVHFFDAIRILHSAFCILFLFCSFPALVALFATSLYSPTLLKCIPNTYLCM